MSSTDIYGTSGRVVPNQGGSPPVSPRRRRKSRSSSENESAEKTPRSSRRRQKNTGFRRFLHLMKKPDFSRRFWIATLSIVGVILILLLVWDRFFRYEGEDTDVLFSEPKLSI